MGIDHGGLQAGVTELGLDGANLVRFDVTVKSFGLACHNPSKNSLYILESDLEKTE